MLREEASRRKGFCFPPVRVEFEKCGCVSGALWDTMHSMLIVALVRVDLSFGLSQM